MTPAPEPSRPSPNRRRGDAVKLTTRLALAVGLVITIAVVFNVAIHKLERSPPVQPVFEAAAPKADPQGEARPVTAPVPALENSRGIVALEDKRPLIEAAVGGFFKAATVEDKLAFSRDPDRVRPFMRRYYLDNPLRSRSISGLGTCQSVAEKGQRLGYVQANFAKESAVSVIVEEGDDGSFRVDWESLVHYSEMPWEEFLKEKPTTPTLLRVLVSREKSTLRDGLHWLEIRSPGREQRVSAGFDPEDPRLQSMIEQLETGGWKSVPLTLRLWYSEPKLNVNAARIAGSEGKGWLILTDRRS